MKRAAISFLAVAALVVGAAGSSHAGTGQLTNGQFLFPGQMITHGCFYRTFMQHDGNLVTYGDTAVWASNTVGTGAYAQVAVGQLLIYNWSGQVVWRSNREPPVFCDPAQGGTCPTGDSRLVADDEGRLTMLYDGRVMWTSTYARPFQTQNCTFHPESKTDVSMNRDRWGSDYAGFWLDQPRVSWCANACAQDANCHSYAYVLPGVRGPNAVCFLKNAVPPVYYNPQVDTGQVFR